MIESQESYPLSHNSSFFLSFFSFFAGHISLVTQHTSANLTSADLLAAKEAGELRPVWTFSTASDLHVRFSFQRFNFHLEEFLEIGDGRIPHDDTRLVLFRGKDLPSDVTSVSNAAWMRVKVLSHDTTFPEMDLNITATTHTGKCDLIFFSFVATMDFVHKNVYI